MPGLVPGRSVPRETSAPLMTPAPVSVPALVTAPAMVPLIRMVEPAAPLTVPAEVPPARTS